MTVVYEELMIQGIPISRGISIGRPFFLNREELKVFESFIPISETEREIERYWSALSKSKQDLKRLQIQLEAEAATEAIKILEAQIAMLQDPLLTSEIENKIRQTNKNAEYVFQQAILEVEAKFQSLENSFFIERFADIQDLSRRILNYLNNSGHISLHDISPNSIVCTEEITASDIAEAKSSCVEAFISESGGSTSHAAIIAKAKGIPYVTNIPLETIKEKCFSYLIVDGRTGEVILNPTEETLKKYKKLQILIQDQIKKLEHVIQWPAETYDGHSVRLTANLEMSSESEVVHQLGGQGIGLFRSEYIFLPKNEIPSEDEQCEIYSDLIKKMKGLPVVIRTFDLGGDKTPSQFPFNGRNPFLGCRATRFLLKQPDLFKIQLRAILRASKFGRVSILFPMISTLVELREAKKMVDEAKAELNIDHHIPIGCMIEVPSAALITDHFARECDFISIGSNDLVQYALAVDRSDQMLSELYEPTDPSVIRLIQLIINEANRFHIPVNVCGEIASDPRFTPLLLGLGIQGLSVTPRCLPVIKNTIRKTSLIEAIQLAEEALNAKTASEVLRILNDQHLKNVPHDLFYTEGAENI